MPDVTTVPPVTSAIDQMLKLCEYVRRGNHRDPMRVLMDTLLEMRHEVTR